jgi:hypothetical protein
MAEHALQVGQEISIGRGFFKRHSMLYAGIPDERVYSIIVTTTAGYRSMAYNLYFPVSRRDIVVAGRRLAVLRVSENELHISE